MRLLTAFVIALGLVASGGALAPAAAADSGYMLAVDQQPGGEAPVPQIDVDITERTVAADWWANPIWIGVGIVALILLIVIVALATRGGGTTIVKD